MPKTPKPEPYLHFRTEPPPPDPVTFSIGPEGDETEFTASSWLPGVSFIKYTRLIRDQGGLISSGAIEEFFNEILDTAEAERFWKFCTDPANNVTAGLLGEAFFNLYTRYAAGPDERSRPTKPPKPSGSGREKTSDGSKASGATET